MTLPVRRAWMPTILVTISAVAVGASALGVPAAAAAPTPALFSVAAHDPLRKLTLPCDKNSTIGIEGCQAHEAIALDRQIDATAAKILVADRPGESFTGAALTAAAATSDLSAAERSWLAVRESDCDSWTDPNAGGTIVGIIFGECAVADGKTRLAELRRQLKAAQSE
jgi:uncharacterized protein YecT (DUF1311 family)